MHTTVLHCAILCLAFIKTNYEAQCGLCLDSDLLISDCMFVGWCVISFLVILKVFLTSKQGSMKFNMGLGKVQQRFSFLLALVALMIFCPVCKPELQHGSGGGYSLF